MRLIGSRRPTIAATTSRAIRSTGDGKDVVGTNLVVGLGNPLVVIALNARDRCALALSWPASAAMDAGRSSPTRTVIDSRPNADESTGKSARLVPLSTATAMSMPRTPNG